MIAMQKITSITAVIAAMLLASPAYAAMISLSPATISVTKGQNFTVAAVVDSGAAKTYTVKSVVSYPAALVEAVSFSFETGWMPLSMSGYDSVDNTSGTLVKTAGFPAGFAGAKSFGTITFKAKESGTANISVGSASLAYDASSKNALSGPQGASTATITTTAPPAPTPAPATSTTPATPSSGTPQTQTTPKSATPKTTTLKGQIAGSAMATTSATTTTQASTTPGGGTSTEAQAAAVGGGLFGGGNGWLFAALAALALVLGGAWWFVRRR